MRRYLSLRVIVGLALLPVHSADCAPRTIEPRLHVFERACLATRADTGAIIALATAERWQTLPPALIPLTPIAGLRLRGWALPGSPLQQTLLVSAQSPARNLKTCAIQFFGGGALAFNAALKNWASSTLVDMTDGPEKWTRVYRLDRADGSMGVILTAGRSAFGSFTVTAHEVRR